MPMCNCFNLKVISSRILLFLSLEDGLRWSSSSKYALDIFDCLPDQFWKDLAQINICGDVDDITVLSKARWKSAVCFLWREVRVHWEAVFCDPYFHARANFLHLSDYLETSEEIFGFNLVPSNETRKIVDEGSVLNSSGEHEDVESFFEVDEKLIRYFDCNRTLSFHLPDGSTLDILLCCEGWYFSIDGLDIGRLDGHQSMPALRWEESKNIASYAESFRERERRGYFPSALVSKYALLLLSYLCYPAVADKDDYIDAMVDKWTASGIIKEDKIALWVEKFYVCDGPDWVRAAASGVHEGDEGGDEGVWIHDWSMRRERNIGLATRVSEIMSRLECPIVPK